MNLRSLLATPSLLMIACGVTLAAEPAVAAKPAVAIKRTFKPGDAVDIADITGAEWLKGEAPKSFEPGKLYIFECWATWCGACIASMPHLNEMHQKFHDKGVLFYGLDVWEKSKADGEKFIRDKPDAMAYPVIHVGRDSPINKKWLEPFNLRGIPQAFVVRDGKLLVACYPGALTEEAITAMLSPESCDKTVAEILRTEELGSRYMDAQFAFMAAEKKGDIAGMKAAIADCERIYPGAERMVARNKSRLAAALAKEKKTEPAK